MACVVLRVGFRVLGVWGLRVEGRGVQGLGLQETNEVFAQDFGGIRILHLGSLNLPMGREDGNTILKPIYNIFLPLFPTNPHLANRSKQLHLRPRKPLEPET